MVFALSALFIIHNGKKEKELALYLKEQDDHKHELIEKTSEEILKEENEKEHS